MSYTITKYNGLSSITIADGDGNADTPLTFLGKGYVPYGEIVDTNLLKLLENTATTVPWSNPVTGQLWFDITERSLKICTNGTNKTYARVRLKSDPTILVPPPQANGTFDISDKVIEGQTLFIDVQYIPYLVSNPTTPITFLWKFNNVGVNSASTYIVPKGIAGIVGGTIQATLSYTNNLGNVITLSSKVKTIAAGPTITVAINPTTLASGAAATVSSTVVDPQNPVGGTTTVQSYTWYLNGIAVKGSVGGISDNTYTIPANSSGKKLKVAANYSNNLIPLAAAWSNEITIT